MEGRSQGYFLVCPDFGEGWGKLDNDTLTRCLAYILTHIDEIAIVPAGIRFEIIPLRRHHFGETYPSIGIPSGALDKSAEEMTDLSFQLGDEITEFIRKTGIDQLVELSTNDFVTWADIRKSDAV